MTGLFTLYAHIPFPITAIAMKTNYSWIRLILTRLIQIYRYFALKANSPKWFALQWFAINYFKLPLFRTIFRFRWEFKIARFNCDIYIV